MSKYIIADIKRVLKRIPYLVILILALFIFGGVNSAGDASILLDPVDLIKSTFIYACVPCGFFAIVFIIGEDLRAKTAQIAIGIGIKREKVVLAKWLECVIFTAINEILLIVRMYLSSIFNGVDIKSTEWGEILLVMLVSILGTGVYVAIVFPIMVASENVSFAMLIYIFLSTGLINKGLGYLEFLEPVQKLHIISKTATNLMNTCRSRVILGNFDGLHWLGLVLYLAVFLGVSVYIYRKHELEF